MSALWIIPAGRTFRGWVRIVNTAAAGNRIRLYVNGVTAAARIYQDTIPAGTTVVVQNLILRPGDQLNGETTDGNATMTAMGSLLLGAPE